MDAADDEGWGTGGGLQICNHDQREQKLHSGCFEPGGSAGHRRYDHPSYGWSRRPSGCHWKVSTDYTTYMYERNGFKSNLCSPSIAPSRWGPSSGSCDTLISILKALPRIIDMVAMPNFTTRCNTYCNSVNLFCHELSLPDFHCLIFISRVTETLWKLAALIEGIDLMTGDAIFSQFMPLHEC